MHVTLKPQEQGLSPILVLSSPFTIGRGEEAFAVFEKSSISRLSRRHAKIFEEDGAIYIADLNSRNGTRVNGHKLTAVPQRLNHEDEIKVGKLTFQIEIEQASSKHTQLIVAPEVTLMLKPLRQDARIATVVITRFPSLIQREGDVFAAYAESAPEQVSFISNKHSHFFIKDGAVFVEDLGSTNGTLVNDVKLGDQPRRLNSGDTIAFGGDFFEYSVHLVSAGAGAEKTEMHGLDDLADSTGTIFIDSPTSFIDIFDTRANSHRGDHSNPSTGSNRRDPPNQRHNKRLPESPQSRRKKSKWGVFAFGMVLVVAVAGYFYFGYPSKSRLQTLLLSADYPAAADLAVILLANAGGVQDTELQAMATAAVLRAYVPRWIAGFNSQDDGTMLGAIESIRMAGVPDIKTHQLTEMLEWATESQRYLASVRTNPGELNRLYNWWRHDIPARRDALQTLADYVPEFEVPRDRIVEQLRALEGQQQQ
jgi:pSer/pThr/pTyr-binding forkhead associated (FHA) protein